MEFGDRSRFAIAIDLDKNHGGSWLLGRFCYWIAGKLVGSYDVGTSLRDVLFQMKYITGDQGLRLCPALLELPEEKIFSLISSALDETSDELLRYATPDFLPARFDVRIPVDVFDSWKIFLVEGVYEAKLLYFRLDSSTLSVATLAPGEFDTVFKSAHAYLDRIYSVSAGGGDL